jgi:hypothetical protein
MPKDSYYNRKQNPTGQPASYLTRGENDPPPARTKAPPSTGDETIDQPGGENYGGNIPEQTGFREIDVTKRSVTDEVSRMISDGSLMRSPYYQQILENQQKLIALRANPTYVNKRGETVRGLKDQDGRMQSGLKAVVDRLSKPVATPDWASFGGYLAGGATAGVAGAVVPEWNEHADRNREIQRLENENARMITEARAVSQMQTQEVNRQEIGRRPEKEAAANKAKVDAATTAFNRRIEYLQKQQDFASGKAQLWTDPEDGKIYRWFPNDPSKAREPVMDPTTGEQDVDPRYKWYDVTSPVSGTRMRLQGKDLFAGESQVEASQVSAENKTNEAEYRWKQDDAELEGKIAAARTRISKAQKRLDEIAKLTGLEKIKSSDEAEKLRKEVRDEESDIAGWEARRKATPKPPEAKGRTGGSVVPPNKDPMKLFQ